MDHVRGVAEDDPARPAPGRRAAHGERPGGALRGDAQLAGLAAAGLRELGLERRRLEREQRLGALGRQRPDECVRVARLGPVERQQRQHVGRAEPLPRDVCMRPRRDQADHVVDT